MAHRFERRLALGLFLAFGIGGCGGHPAHNGDAGADARIGTDRPVSDSAVTGGDAFAPADQAVGVPDSNLDSWENPVSDDGGRQAGDTGRDSAPDGSAVDRAIDSLIPGPDLAPDVPTGTDADSSNPRGTLSVLAGALSGAGGLDGIGSAAQFYSPAGAALDGAGNLYLADSGNHTIRKIVLATRKVSTVAGSLGEIGSQDGSGASARFSSPQGLAADKSGNLYIADSANHTIRRFDVASGEVTTIAGAPGQTGHQDGRGQAARFQAPTGLALDGTGNLFVTDLDNTVRQVVLATGQVTTIAGHTGAPGSNDGEGTAASFAKPWGIVADGAGHLYVADTDNSTIRMIVLATGAVTTIAGSAGTTGSDAGLGSAARFFFPRGLTLDGAGNLFVADNNSSMVRKVVLATAAVSNLQRSEDLQLPNFLVHDGAGHLVVTDVGTHTVSQISLATQEVTTIAGPPPTSTVGNTDGVGAEARFSGPRGLASDNRGALFVVTFWNTIRKIDIASGRVTTLAGSLDGQSGTADGVGPAARFYGPQGLAYDGDGNLYIADTNSCTIRKLALATGMVTTVAGTPHSLKLADGKGSAALFSGPKGLALDGAGNLFVADMHAIRKIVLADATVTTVAGPLDGYGSADGIGAQARFDDPTGLVWDGAGNLFVADTANCTIRQVVVATGLTTTLAGSPGKCDGRDGQGSSAHFQRPVALAMDSAGRLLVADSFDNTIRRIDLATKQVTTIVGHSGRWETIPGPLPAYVTVPAGLAVLPSGDIAISDQTANAILLARF